MNILALTACLALATFAPITFAQEVDPVGSAPAASQKTEGKPINALCPVTGDEEVDPRFTVEYKGKTIGLCCRKCLTKFKADPEAYVANLAGFETVSFDAEPGSEPGRDDADHAHDDGDDDHADHDDADESGGHEPQEHADHTEHGGEDHNHATDHDRSGSKVLDLLGKLHPPATHLPIGMLIGAALAEIGLMLTGRDMFRHAAAFCVALSAAGAVAAASLGWLNGGFVLIDSDWVQATHRWLGTSTALLSLVTLALLVHVSRPSDVPRSRTAFRAALFLSTGLVGATGFFGGALVYGLNHYAL